MSSQSQSDIPPGSDAKTVDDLRQCKEVHEFKLAVKAVLLRDPLQAEALMPEIIVAAQSFFNQHEAVVREAGEGHFFVDQFKDLKNMLKFTDSGDEDELIKVIDEELSID